MDVHIGTAGWNIPARFKDQFAEHGSVLERYTTRFHAVEINSTFHRPHRPSTYERWAETVPDGFLFSAKVPREVTHLRKLVDTEEPMGNFIQDIRHLGSRLGPMLVQLPPSLRFEASTVRRFLALVRATFDGPVVCEPRHASWFEDAAEDLLREFQVARVAADPAPTSAGARPGGWNGLSYWRLHGSPAMYRSGYSEEFLASLKEAICASARLAQPCWCIFDNTTLGEATGDALSLQQDLIPSSRSA